MRNIHRIFLLLAILLLLLPAPAHSETPGMPETVETRATLRLSGKELVIKTATEGKTYLLEVGKSAHLPDIPGLRVQSYEYRIRSRMQGNERVEAPASILTLLREDASSFQLEEGKPQEAIRTELRYKDGSVITRWRLVPATK